MTASGGIERGQATVEFALVLPLIVLLVVGVVQIGRITALQVGVVDAARAGARAAVVEPESAAAQAATDAVGSTGSTDVALVRTGGDPALVTVEVTRTVQVLPGLGWSRVHLQASATTAVESTE